jgi:thioredoxin reductase
VVDQLPPVPGAEELLGKGLHHCPYCDGWELRDRRLIVYGKGDADGAHFALALTRWSDDLVLCTDGPSGCTEDALARLRRARIPVIEQRVRRFARAGDEIEAALDDGTSLRGGGVFFNTTRRHPGDLLEQLGCQEAEPTGCRIEDPSGRCSVAGLHVIGDASRDVLQVIVAAAEGTRAAIAINQALLREDDILPAETD